MRKNEFKKRMLKYVIPYTERIIKIDRDTKIKAFPEAKEIYEYGANMFAETIQDMFMSMYRNLYDGTDDADVSMICQYFDGIMICWSDIPLRMIDKFEYEDEEDIANTMEGINTTGVQLQMIVDWAKQVMSN